jgi:hypothetical protein
MLGSQARYYSVQLLSGAIIWLLTPFTAGRLALIELARISRTHHQQQKLKEIVATALECKKQLERMEEELAATEFGLDASFATWVEIHQLTMRKLVDTYSQFYPTSDEKKNGNG